VVVTKLRVKVAQKADAVALLAFIKLAQACLLGSRQARTAGRRERRASLCILLAVWTNSS